MKVFAIALLLLTFCAAAHAGGPLETAQGINQAIANGDTEAFQKLVDMDGLLNQAFQSFLAEINRPEAAAQLPPILSLMLTQAANQENIRQALLGEAKAFVLNGIASGAFAGKNLDSIQQQGILAPLFANASLGRKEIIWIGEPAADKEDWLLPMVVRDYGNGRDYPLTGRFARSAPDSFRLKGIENMQDIFAQIRQEIQDSSGQ